MKNKNYENLKKKGVFKKPHVSDGNPPPDGLCTACEG